MKKHTEMRGIKLDSKTGFVVFTPSYVQFLSELHGKKVPHLVGAVVNDFLDCGDLQTLDDMKKVIKFYEWREALRESAFQRKIAGLAGYAKGLEEQLQQATDERRSETAAAAARARSDVPGQVAIPRAAARVTAGPAAVRPPPLAPGGREAESEALDEGGEALALTPDVALPETEGIRRIMQKIQSVKRRTALTSDAEIDRIFEEADAELDRPDDV